ncbi:MAG TPA: saccharopine dehydrogenase NADP-binding domain-containing protein [Polyangiaceae bacterium]|nr:saccharopine dehydrogenase NADP-binding domain-containing protein [Polyangiaceae bacterium]
MKERLLIYGATGYTGRLLAAEAARRRLPVVLGARRRDRLESLAEELDLPCRVLGLETPLARKRRLDEDAKRPIPGPGAPVQPAARPAKQPGPNDALHGALTDVAVVLNAAGPFAETAMPLARACVKTNTHYVDISGEYDVFRELNELHVHAKERGTSIVPGAGLTVLASDCLIRDAVARARERGMLEPHTVRVALSRVPAVSRGSVRTMLDGVRDGVRVLRNGKDEFHPMGTLVRSFTFGAEQAFALGEARVCTAMSLADTLTAGATACRAFQGRWAEQQGVPNVEAYLEASSLERMAYELGGEFALALRSQPLKLVVDRVLAMWPEGPGAEERDEARQQVVVEIEDRYRRGVVARLSTQNSYDFTVQKALELCETLRTTHSDERGVVSPAWVLRSGILHDDETSGSTETWGDWQLEYRGLPRRREAQPGARPA